MPDLRSILTLQPKRVEIIGLEVFLKRPTIVDLAEMTEANERDPKFARLFALSRHILDADLKQVFPTPADAESCPAKFAVDAIVEIEKLYGEGLD